MTSDRTIQNIGMRNRSFLLLFINNLSVNLYFLKTSSEIYFSLIVLHLTWQLAFWWNLSKDPRDPLTDFLFFWIFVHLHQKLTIKSQKARDLLTRYKENRFSVNTGWDPAIEIPTWGKGVSPWSLCFARSRGSDYTENKRLSLFRGNTSTWFP